MVQFREGSLKEGMGFTKGVIPFKGEVLLESVRAFRWFLKETRINIVSFHNDTTLT